MTLLQRFRDPLVSAGALGGLLVFSLLLVHLPASIYGGNVSEFSYGLSVYLVLGLAIVVAAEVGLIALLILSPRLARTVVAGLLCGVGLVMWAYGNILLGNTIVLDGRHQEFDFSTRLGGWEPIAVLAAVLAVAAVTARYAKPVVIFLVVLNVGLLLSTTVEIIRDPRLADPLRRQDAGAFLRFSRDRNVLLVLLDSMQSDVFDRVVSADPTMRQGLDGFTLFRDAVGVAPTTLLSMPAIHSGRIYRPGESVGQYYEEGVRKGSFLNRLAEAGFETTVVNPIKNVCPERVALCTSTTLAAGKRSEELRDSALLLLDFSIFRVAPFLLKAHVYNGNWWLLSSVWRRSMFAGNILGGNQLLALLGSNARVTAGAPTAKFIHLQSTHPPFILHGDCESISFESTPSNPDGQVRCAVRSFISLLEAMKAEAVYDNTTILLIADHGYGHPSGYVGANQSGDRWTMLAGAANPTFLLKPPMAHGELSNSDEPVSLVDVSATLCALNTIRCSTFSGNDVTRAMSPRPRLFTWHEWQHEWWQRDVLPTQALAHYAVVGPLWEHKSWQYVDALVQRYPLGATMGFQSSSERPPLSSFEWSHAEPPGTWVDGHEANLFLHLDKVPDEDLQLVVDAYAFLPTRHSVQNVHVLVNDAEVARWSFDPTNPRGVRTAHVPHSLVTSESIKITFLLPDAISPAAVGLSTDQRILSLGLTAMRVVATGPDTLASSVVSSSDVPKTDNSRRTQLKSSAGKDRQGSAAAR